MSSSKKITLKSSDGVSFEVDKAVAPESQTIKHMIEDDCADNGIPLPNVTSEILAKVIEYCKKHADLKAWDAEFVRVEQDTLFDFIQVLKLRTFEAESPTFPLEIDTRNPKDKRSQIRLVDSLYGSWSHEEEGTLKLDGFPNCILSTQWEGWKAYGVNIT